MPSQPIRLLLIESEQILVEVLRKKLTTAGFSADIAQDGEDGLQKIKTQPPAVIIIDLTLPKMTGLDVLKTIKQDKTLQAIPVLAISNSDDPAEISQLNQLGIQEYLIKTTLTPDEVLKKVQALTSGAPAQLASPAQTAPLMKPAAAPQTPPAQPQAPQPQAAPLQQVPAQQSPVVAPATTQATTTGAKVVIAEDDKFLRELASKKLSSAGYHLTAAMDGAEAIKVISEVKPDVVLLDIIMPDIDGFEVLKRIRASQDEKIKNTKVIILSNLGQDSDIEKGKELQATDYLVKANFTMDEIITKVESALAKK